MARRRKPTVKPVLSAFIWGVLTFIGIDPGQLIFQTALKEFGPYLQFASLIILLVVIYFSYNSILDGLKRARHAYRRAGIVGILAIVAAFAAGFFVYAGERAVLVLVIAIAMWLYATWR